MHAPSPDSHLPVPRPRYRWALHRYACFCAGAILFLICVGGVVTSTEAGMSVPDWPTSYGYNMFYFPWQFWTGGIFWEHSHRLDATGVGLLIIGLAVWLCYQERIWLRWMGGGAVILVILQGVIGGLRVAWRMDWLGVPHAMLAQSFFVFVSLIALFTSNWWMEGHHAILPPQWTARLLAICALIFAQLMIGATMRHEHAGLSITDFPLAYGQAWPKVDPASVDAYNTERLARHEVPTTAVYIMMQMVHRVGAVLITASILAVAAAAWVTPGTPRMLRRWVAGWVALVFVQFTLGALTIWTNKAADVATTHVAVGAMTLVVGALLTAASWRLQSRGELATRGVA
jgi:cytochrome c oxidase assembly protein subunit 15